MKTKGWQKVFSFTFIQYVRTKSFIVGTILICIFSSLICVLTNVLPNIINSDKSSEGSLGGEVTNVEEFLNTGRLYLFDETNVLDEEDKQTLSEIFGGRFSEPTESLNAVTDRLSASDSAEIAVRISSRNDKDGKIWGYEVRSYYSANAKGSADMTGGTVSELINRRILLNAGVSPEKYEDTRVSVTTSKTEAGGKNLSAIQGMVNYALPLVISIVLFMLIFTYGSIVAQSIATEKTSRVMELLLTSVRPLAVVIGKVLAMGLVSFLQFALIILVGMASFTLSNPFGWIGDAMELLKDPEMQAALSQMTAGGAGSVGAVNVSTSELEMAQAVSDLTSVFTPANIISIVVIFILGFLFYSLVAALIGASISRMEDLQAAMAPYSVIGVFGMYLAYFPIVFNVENLENGDAAVNPVQLFSYFFPVSSPFALPSAVLLGTLEPWKIAVSIGLLAVFVALIAVVVGKVYEAIILHNGNRIKLSDILKMAVRR